MESVVASVSGYVGADRSSLIKLINGSGGYFVGSLGRATTHLVCWAFQGPKYDLAKKLGTLVINHRWFEDCMKAGRRLPETPYTILCGKAVGPLHWKEPQLDTTLFSESNFCKVPKECRKDSPFSSSLGIDLGGKELEGKGRRSQKASCSKIGQKASCSGIGLKLRKEEKIQNDVCVHERSRVRTNHLKILSEERANKPGRGNSVQNEGEEAFGILPKESNRGKNKVLEVFQDTDVSYKIPKRPIQLSSAKMERARQRKTNHSTDKVSCGILDMDLEDNKNTLQNSTEGVYNTSCNTIQHSCSNMLSIADEMTMLNYKCVPNETGPENDKCIPCNSVKATERTEKSAHEPISSQVLYCTDETCTLTSKEPAASPVASMPYNEIACVICHTEKISSAEGLLSCGHSFCFLCIKKWALEAASKASTCPLCKTPFDMITKREGRTGLDDLDLYSQRSVRLYDETVVLLGCNKNWKTYQMQEPTNVSFVLPSDQMQEPTNNSACIMCGNRDMDDLLLTCSGCCRRSAHTFCLDPPIPITEDTPWFCGRCTQGRRADTTWWYQLHQFEAS